MLALYAGLPFLGSVVAGLLRFRGISVLFSLAALAVFLLEAPYGGRVASALSPALFFHFEIVSDPVAQAFAVLISLTAAFALWYAPAEDAPWFGFFSSLMLFLVHSANVLTFYVFWETIPLAITLYFFRRNLSSLAVRYFLYSFSGSLGTLAVMAILVYGEGLTIDPGTPLTSLASVIPPQSRGTLAIAFLLAFLIKMPLFPLHGWLSIYYREAPGSFLLMSGLFMKMSVLGWMRFAQVFSVQPEFRILAWLGIIGMLYSSFLAWKSTGLRELMGYSSMAHMNLIMVGMSSALPGASFAVMMTTFAHTLASSVLMAATWFVETRYRTDDFISKPGLAGGKTFFGLFFLLPSLSIIGFPGTAGFAGEFMLIRSSLQMSLLAGLLAVSGVILSALYVTRQLQLTIFHEPAPDPVQDLNWKEILPLSVFVILILALGLFPGLLPESWFGGGRNG